MPKAPILDREMFVERVRQDGSLRPLDFYLVNTSLGAMVEPRPVAGVAGGSFNADADRTDASFSRINEVREEDLAELQTRGLQAPTSW